MINIKEILKKNLAEAAYERIKFDIESGLLPEGTKIPSENQLSQSLNVSRVVVREALEMLRDEHIIVTRKGSGSYVANPKNFLTNPTSYDISASQFEEIMEFRACIEHAAIKRAASRATREDLERISACYYEMEKSIDDPIAFTLSDYSFHHAIIEAAHNSVFTEVIDSKSKDIIKCFTMMNQLNDSRRWALGLHKSILEKMLSRDAKGTVTLLKNNEEYNIARIEEFSCSKNKI